MGEFIVNCFLSNADVTNYVISEGGASQNPCSETYAGPSAFSEPETVALSNFIGSLGHKINIYLAFHSYGHYILYPYGHTIEPADNVVNLVCENFFKKCSTLKYIQNF